MVKTLRITNSSMPLSDLESFIDLISGLFKKNEQNQIDENTDIKQLKEWSSLQTMIVVNEIDRKYNVILDVEDFKNAESLKQLFNIIQSKGS